MGVTGLLPALQVQAETGARYLKKACGSAVGVDLAGWLHECAAHDYRSAVLEANHAPVVKAVMEPLRSVATRCPFYAPPEVHHHLHLRVAKRDLCAANWTFVSVYILHVYTSNGKSLCKNDFYCPHSITLSPRKSACNAEKTHSSATKSPATTLAPGENGRFWHQSASASRCGGSWLENLPFCPYTWLPVDRFSSQAGCV